MYVLVQPAVSVVLKPTACSPSRSQTLVVAKSVPGTSFTVSDTHDASVAYYDACQVVGRQLSSALATYCDSSGDITTVWSHGAMLYTMRGTLAMCMPSSCCYYDSDDPSDPSLSCDIPPPMYQWIAENAQAYLALLCSTDFVFCVSVRVGGCFLAFLLACLLRVDMGRVFSQSNATSVSADWQGFCEGPPSPGAKIVGYILVVIIVVLFLLVVTTVIVKRTRCGRRCRVKYCNVAPIRKREFSMQAAVDMNTGVPVS